MKRKKINKVISLLDLEGKALVKFRRLRNLTGFQNLSGFFCLHSINDAPHLPTDALHPINDALHFITDALHPIGDAQHVIDDVQRPITDALHSLDDAQHPITDALHPKADAVNYQLQSIN